MECAVPKLAIQVLGSGGSRRAAEQAAAKLALEQVQALVPPTPRRTRKSAQRSDALHGALSSDTPEVAGAPVNVPATGPVDVIRS